MLLRIKIRLFFRYLLRIQLYIGHTVHNLELCRILMILLRCFFKISCPARRILRSNISRLRRDLQEFDLRNLLCKRRQGKMYLQRLSWPKCLVLHPQCTACVNSVRCLSLFLHLTDGLHQHLLFLIVHRIRLQMLPFAADLRLGLQKRSEKTLLKIDLTIHKMPVRRSFVLIILQF